jgi:hypothetical protein
MSGTSGTSASGSRSNPKRPREEEAKKELYKKSKK